MDYTIQRLELSKKDMNVRLLHAYIGYSPTSSEDEANIQLLDGLTVWLARLDA